MNLEKWYVSNHRIYPLLDVKTLSEMELLLNRNIDSLRSSGYFLQWALDKGYHYLAPLFVKVNKTLPTYQTDLKDGLYRKEELMFDDYKNFVTSHSY